jgi:transketolase
MANAIRALAMDAVEQAKAGHPGLPMGAADIATVLFTLFLKFDPADPTWPDRDRFVLSAGHGSMLLYALLHLLGYEKMTIAEIKRFRQLGSLTPGHPEHGHTPGVETTTGPLGQGIAAAVGMAIAERHLAALFGSDVVDHKTYVLASDGDLMEGISQEAIALAGHLKLKKLIVLFDDNHISIDGPTSLSDSVDQVKRFESAGWTASRIDGHDPEAITVAIEAAQRSDKPTMIACRTTIGFGAPNKGGTEKVHGSPLGAEEVAAARQKLGWTSPPSKSRRTFSRRGAPLAPGASRRTPLGSSGSRRSTPANAPNSNGACAAILPISFLSRSLRSSRHSPRRRRKLPPARPPSSRSRP